MKPKQMVVALLLGWLVVSGAGRAEAQSRPHVPRTYAPHLDALRRYPGPLQGFNYNYYSPGRPGANLDRALAAQQQVLNRQATTIRELQGVVDRAVRQGGIRPTGAGARFMNRTQFMNRSHYYSGVGSGGVGGGAGAGRRSAGPTSYRGAAQTFGSYSRF